MIPISTTSQGGEAPAANVLPIRSAAIPWTAAVLPLPRSTIVKRTAGLKPKFDAEMLSACAVLQKWAFSGHLAAALHLAENGRRRRIFLATYGSRRRAGRIDSTGALRPAEGSSRNACPAGVQVGVSPRKPGSISGEGRGEHDRVGKGGAGPRRREPRGRPVERRRAASAAPVYRAALRACAARRCCAAQPR